MTDSRTHRFHAFLASLLLLGALTLAACAGHSPVSSSDGSIEAPVAAPQQVATRPASISASTAATTAPSEGAAETAEVEQNLAGISNQLAAAGDDLQDGPTEQTIDPRG